MSILKYLELQSLGTWSKTLFQIFGPPKTRGRAMVNKKLAFTLIELLVVIAIIAILAAILFPVFAQAKVAAKKTQDISNIKQIGTAMQIYVTDYDDRLPMAILKDPIPVSVATPPDYNQLGTDKAWTWTGSPSDQAPTEIYWTYGQTTFPYHKNMTIFKSPNSPNSGGNPGHANYGVNWNIMGVPIWDPAHAWPLSTTEIDGVAEKVLLINGGNVILYQYNMIDVARWGGFDYIAGACPNGVTTAVGANGVDCQWYQTGGAPSSIFSDISKGRHNQSGINVGYADSHAKYSAYSALAAKQGSAWCPAGSTGWDCN